MYSQDTTKDGAKVALWDPDEDNKPQQRAYECEAKVIGYGGAAGGGKTDLGIGLGLTKYKSTTLFRRDGTEHTDNLARVTEIVGTNDGLNRTTKHWRNLPRGHDILFAAMPNEEDKQKFKGRRRNLMVFDEATEFNRSQIDFVMGWCLDKALLTFNPPTTIEAEWVIDYFAPWLDEDHILYPHPDGDVLYYANIDDNDMWLESDEPIDDGDGHMITPQSRTFFHARVEDNKYMIDVGYDKQLESLPTELRNQVRYGLIKRISADNPLQLVPREWVRMAQKRWRDCVDAGGPAAYGWQCDQTGADIARGGKDRQVHVNRYDKFFTTPDIHKGEVTDRGSKSAALIANFNRDGAPIGVDVVNVGNSTFDHLEETDGIEAVPLNGGMKSGSEDYTGKWIYATDKSGKYKLRNKRTEWWWRLMEALDPDHGENLMLPEGQEVLKEICSVRYKIVGGLLALELKQDVIKRLGVSPDIAEAIVYAHADLEAVESVNPEAMLASMAAAASV